MTEARPLRLGMFVMPIHDPTKPLAQCIDEDLELAVGPFGSLILVAHDWDDRDRWLRSLELFANEVMPRFNSTIASSTLKRTT